MNEIVYKEDGRKQMANVALTPEIASALYEKVITLGKVRDHRDAETIQLFLRDEEGNKIPFPIEISVWTYESWIKRGNVIPGVGETLKDYLDKARKELELRRNAKLNREIRARAKLNLHTIENIPIMSDRKEVEIEETPRKDGSIKVTKTTKVITGHDPQLIRQKLDATKFALTALDPEYVPKTDNKNKNANLSFSLADLRRAARESGMDV